MKFKVDDTEKQLESVGEARYVFFVIQRLEVGAGASRRSNGRGTRSSLQVA